MRTQPVEHEKPLQRVIGYRHALGQFLRRLVGAHGDDLQPQRMDRRAFLQAHASEGCDRLAEGAVARRRHRLGGEDEAIDVAAEAQGKQPERPLLAFGGRGRHRKAVDLEFLDAAGIDILDPARLEIICQRLFGRHADKIEAHGLAAAVLEAKHRLRRIVEREAGRRREGEAKLGMLETPAAGETFARVFAINNAIEIGEVVGAVALAGARPGKLAGIRQRVLHPLGRRRMAG